MGDTSQSQGFDWGSIINAALAIYGAGKGSGSTPNFYNVPLTPAEKNIQDTKGSLFNYASAYNDQYLRGLGNMNPDWQMPTNAVGNPQFMGGIHVPVIDWSKMPPPPKYTPTDSKDTKPTLPGAGTNATDPSQKIPGPAGQDPFAGWPDPSPGAHEITWDDIKTYGPGVVKIVEAVLTGNPGMGLGAAWNWVQTHVPGFGNNQLPTGNVDPNKYDLTPAPDPNKPPDKSITLPKPTPPQPGDTRNVDVGGNLGLPGGPPPGWTLDNPYQWYGNMYGSGGGGTPDLSNLNNWGKYKP